MEYTAAIYPQQNALMEVKFTYLAAKARAAMHAAEVPRDRRLEFFPEVVMTTTKLDWLKLITIKKVKKTRIEHYGLPLPSFTQYLRTWGEAGIMKTGKVGKIGDRGVTGMFVGYASNHKGNCYRMWNLNTKKVSETHVMWCFSTGCSSEHLQCQYIRNKVLMMKILTVSNKTRGGVL
jgi:hypothetical protein